VTNERRVLELGDGILSEASQGQQERARLGLDDIDRTDQVVTVKITSPVVTSSFIRGFVGPSVRELGYDKFVKKYEFQSSPNVKSNILANARYASDLEK
jgi:hypothetical protein